MLAGGKKKKKDALIIFYFFFSFSSSLKKKEKNQTGLSDIVRKVLYDPPHTQNINQMKI